MTALIGRYADDNAFAAVTVCGCMPNACAPQSSPVRPKPVMTSSSMSRTSCFVEHGLDLREIAARRQQHAADAHQRLGDERGDRVRPFALNQLLEVRASRVA